jgi:hypothetical protein
MISNEELKKIIEAQTPRHVPLFETPVKRTTVSPNPQAIDDLLKHLKQREPIDLYAEKQELLQKRTFGGATK